MSLYGVCDDCGDQATLRYKPDLALDDQPRPSVCNCCRMRREERMVDQFREERPVPPHVPPTPDEGECK
ncbi:hypothetical protein GS429_12195 [Natronorubrum sp. JWXQ-INN-674]|uniref:Uncharacterized protein n=1 Tax=Natronorubrum halalkaliphilum TaxID=2691917 RepID=A0A6B0VPV7_9EURY|nr:hypothetical protein [Natronorubrum halalkaliphilum]MXV62812.1 hypothetical protein [Natronorubrum halalkaliphilum]